MVFCFVQKFSFEHESCNIFFFFVANFFFQESPLGYMTKTLNQIIFFPPQKSEYFFQQHWESEYFFQKKNITPPFKLNGRSLTYFHAFSYLFESNVHYICYLVYYWNYLSTRLLSKLSPFATLHSIINIRQQKLVWNYYNDLV